MPDFQKLLTKMCGIPRAFKRKKWVGPKIFASKSPLNVNYPSSGLRVSGVEVPHHLVVGQRATLKCHVDLDGEILYSLKWWKNGMQFYQFIPNNKPPAVVFTVEGISVNVSI